MIENSIVYRDFKGKYEYLPLARAQGARIWDRAGKEYIDFTSGWNVTNLGWNHPEVAEAVIAQTKKNVQGLLWGSDPIQEEYAAALTAALPDGLDACVKATSGTEAIEVSAKIARVYTGRQKLIGFNGQYHGQLFASLALGAPSEARGKLNPLVPQILTMDFPDAVAGQEVFNAFVVALEEALSQKDVAAVVTEPGIITGWGTTRVAFPGFLTAVRELTEKYGTLLIVDEVGSGFSRTGTLFGIQHENVVPDLVAFAKGISNGAAAIGTTVGRSELMETAFSEAILISTFGWTPVACAAALATLQIHQRDKTYAQAQQKGDYIKEKLTAHLGDVVTDVRGMGMELGLELRDADTARRVQKAAFADGLHIVVGSGNNIQLMPPLTISQSDLDEGLGILEKHLRLI